MRCYNNAIQLMTLHMYLENWSVPNTVPTSIFPMIQANIADNIE